MSVGELDKNGLRPTAVRFALCMLLIGAIYPFPSAAGTFQQDAGGVVSMEAESYSANLVAPDGHAWLSAGGSFAGYSGTDALQALPDDGTRNGSGYSTLSPQLDYAVNFVATGTHYLWVRGWAPSLASDAFHAGLDGQEVGSGKNLRGSGTGGYIWISTKANGVRATLDIASAGEHTVNLWMNESGFVVDKVVLSTDEAYDPSTLNGGLGPAESSQGSPTDADLAVSKTVDTAMLLEGDTVVYTVTVTNNGPLDATGVVLGDALPAGLTYVSDDSGGGYASGTGLWTVGTLLNGGQALLHITATVDTGTGGSTLTNTASVTASDQADPNVSNNVATVDILVATSMPAGLLDYWKLDETVGPSYANVVSGSPSASCTSCPTPVAGRINGGQQFDGSTDEVNVADDGSFDWATDARFSVEAWVRHSGACSVTGETVVGRRDAASQLSWSLGCQGSNATFTLIDTGGAGVPLTGSTDITDGNWHHLVAMRDAISGKNFLYVDGVEEASAAVNYSGTFGGGTSLNIGWLNDSGSDYHFGGVIDEVALHDRVLPDSEIARHYADGTVGLQRGYQGCGSVVRIMPLGDSITRHWNPGFRPGLYFDLVNAGMDIDMVGSVKDSCDPNCAHDPDNEGHSGFTATNIATNVATWLSQNPPDVVMLHIGTNVDPSFPYPDVTQVGQILDGIKSYDPAVPVVLARIINKARTSYDPQLSVYNDNLGVLAQSRIASGDRIVVVDQEPGLDYSNTTTDFDVGDDLHPTAGGNAKMVPVWFEGLNRFMPACNDVVPQVISQAVTTGTSGVPYVYVVEVTGVPAPSFSLGSAPAGMTIHPDTGRIEWTPPSTGSYAVTVQVTNSMGSDTQNFTIVVN